MQNDYVFVVLPVALTFLVISTMGFVNASFVSTSDDPDNVESLFHYNNVLTDLSNPYLKQASNTLMEETRSSFIYVSDTLNPSIVNCQGATPCLKGQVVKVLDGKSFYVSINDRIVKVDLALIGLPVVNQQAMIAATTFTRNTCLGGTVLIDQDDGQKSNSIIGIVYCSPTKSLNAMLLDTGYVQLDRTQCLASEFSKLDWAKSRGC